MSALNLQYEVMQAIDAIVESEEPMETIHATVQNIRQHLEARAHQTATPFIPAARDGSIVVPPLNTNIADVSVPDELAALLGVQP